MMFDIKTASIEALLKDKTEAEETLRFSTLMWQRGIRNVDGMSLRHNISVDERVIAMIDAEMEQRSLGGDVKATTYTAFRDDSWPLCPRCGQDELWSDIWNRLEPKPTMTEFIANIRGCYACGWKPSSLGALVAAEPPDSGRHSQAGEGAG